MIAYQDDLVTLYHGDCRDTMPRLPAGDVVVTDPPYGDTSLGWDRRIEGWVSLVRAPQVWVFSSLRALLRVADDFTDDGWRLAQEVVWEKHNGSGFHADRFRRVHEFAVHFYRGKWSDLYREVQTTPDATKRARRTKTRPPHTGHIEMTPYVSEDGGPRLMRSVLRIRSEHGRAIHPTQKPLGILDPLIRFSCPPDGLVVDPFAGSASTLVAARAAGRRAIGIEIDDAYCEAAVRRLEATNKERTAA